MVERILVEHFTKVKNILLSSSEHINIPQHGDVKGSCREIFVTEFLQKHCPSIIQYRTGEIIDIKDQRTGQLDIILQSTISPSIPLSGNIQIAMADTVMAIIEVKSNLTTANWNNTSHLKSALENFHKVKRLTRMNGSSDNYHKKIPCILFAYKAPQIDTLIHKLLDYGRYFALDIDDYMPDVISALEQGYAITRDNGFLSQKKECIFIKWNQNPSTPLAIPFMYISRISEAWHQKPLYFTPFLNYLGEQ